MSVPDRAFPRRVQLHTINVSSFYIRRLVHVNRLNKRTRLFRSEFLLAGPRIPDGMTLCTGRRSIHHKRMYMSSLSQLYDVVYN